MSIATCVGLSEFRQKDLHHIWGHAKSRYKVETLPGIALDNEDLYSGYIQVDEIADRNLFFVLVKSLNEYDDGQKQGVNTKKLVLWLNGGPGCSSLGGGFLSELGPFYPDKDGKHLRRNQYAWNTVADVVFLESPAFVGFSYSADPEDATVGDERTAKDTYAFLSIFVQEFPEYRNADIYIAGESYGGHYVPQAAHEILKQNEGQNAKLNLVGFLVGNAWSDASIDNRAAVDFWFTHRMISGASYHGIGHTCDFSSVGPLMVRAVILVAGNALTDPEIDSGGAILFWHSHGMISTSSFDGVVNNCNLSAIYPLQAKAHLQLQSEDPEDACEKFVKQAMGEFSGVNIYDIYVDVCRPKVHTTINHFFSVLADQTVVLKHHHGGSEYDPCIDNEVQKYLNRRDVQDALHANTSGSIPGPWTSCTDKIKYSRADLLSSVVPLYEELIDMGLRILVYSGDIDAIVPIIGTRRWLETLNLEEENPWRPWESSTGQVGGWTLSYQKNISFASVRGAGHMVPYTQPERAFYLFKHWLHSLPL